MLYDVSPVARAIKISVGNYMKKYLLCIYDTKKVICDSDSLSMIQIQKRFYEEQAENDGLIIKYAIYTSDGDLIEL